MTVINNTVSKVFRIGSQLQKKYNISVDARSIGFIQF